MIGSPLRSACPWPEPGRGFIKHCEAGVPACEGMSALRALSKASFFVVREDALLFDKFLRFLYRFSRFQPVIELLDGFHEAIAAVCEDAIVPSASHG